MCNYESISIRCVKSQIFCMSEQYNLKNGSVWRRMVKVLLFFYSLFSLLSHHFILFFSPLSFFLIHSYQPLIFLFCRNIGVSFNRSSKFLIWPAIQDWESRVEGNSISAWLMMLELLFLRPHYVSQMSNIRHLTHQTSKTYSHQVL